MQVVDWRERPKPEKLFISAQILVAKSSQVRGWLFAHCAG